MAIDRPPVPAPGPVPGGLVRVHDGRVLAGVCAGVGRRLGVDPLVVRLAAVVLTAANGLGILAYLGAWAFLPDEGAAPNGAGPGRPGAGGAPAPGAARSGEGGAERTLAVGLITLGTLLALRELGLLLPGRIIWPVALGALGVALVWPRADRDRLGALAGRAGDPVEPMRPWRAVLVRVLGGVALVVAGVAVLMHGGAVGDLGRVVAAVLVTAAGVVLLLGPWVVRLWRELGDERRQRIRSQERAEVAAHLHDSVLQTLTLIQRADGPGRARGLARRQERELRAWLYGERDPAAPTTLHAALEATAGEVEADHDVVVEVVVVGDCPLDGPVEALAQAVREATVNAARHAGVDEVAVYVEVEDDRVTAYVRDRGVGFDPAAVGPGRLGIARSIVGRMESRGGRVEIASTPGEGTEVTVEVPRP